MLTICLNRARRLVASFSRPLAFLAMSELLLSGCASMSPPANSSSEFYVPAKLDTETTGVSCNLVPIPPTPRIDTRLLGMSYSPGDRLSVMVVDGPEFSGDVVIDTAGALNLPLVGPVAAAGVDQAQLQQTVENSLIEGGYFRPGLLKVSVRPVLYAPIEIDVAGAVFRPGRVTINAIKDGDKQDAALRKTGDAPLDRSLGTALRSAGGVRPDADLAAVTLVRAGVRYTLDWRGAMRGHPVADLPLVAGDRIEVPMSDCFDTALVRPSNITPDGVRVFMSNLTVPAQGNAPAGVGQFASSLPYGTKLLQALVSANCVGGSLATNANRYAVLMSSNPHTGETEVVQRSVEQLVRSADRDRLNPYLMPDDAIACYDSGITDLREVASTLTGLLAPYGIARLALGGL